MVEPYICSNRGPRSVFFSCLRDNPWYDVNNNLASFCMDQPTTVGPPITPMGHDGLSTASMVQPAAVGPAAAASFNTATVPGALQDPAGLLDPTSGPSASSDLVCFALNPLSPGKLIRQPPTGLVLAGPGVGAPLTPVLVDLPEGLPAQAVDSPGPAESLAAPRSERHLKSPPLHRSKSLTTLPPRHLEAAHHRSMENLKVEPRLVRWPGSWRLCRSQMERKD
jgi:hypothetical protein